MHKHDIIRTTTGSGQTILVRYAKKINRVRENSASFPAHGYRGLCCSISNGSRIPGYRVISFLETGSGS